MSEEEKKILYLQMLQEPIGRMSTISSIIKGFTITILAGVIAWNSEEFHIEFLVLGILPIIMFMFLDIYYLSLERKFKYRYEQVRSGHHPVNFCMKLEHSCKETIAANATLEKCFCSLSIWLFYLPLMIIVGLILYIK